MFARRFYVVKKSEVVPNTKIHLHTLSESITDSQDIGKNKTHNVDPLCLTVPTLSTRPQGLPACNSRNLAFIPVTVHSEGQVEAISTEYSNCLLYPLKFTSCGLISAHAR